MPGMSKPLFAAILIASLTLSSCSLLRTYRGDISQGNVVTKKMVASIHPGQSRRSVEHHLGQPVMSQPLHTHQLVYLYRFQPGYGQAKQTTLTIHFNRHDKVTSYKVST